ncbi:SDR family oxidoreductase [Massilia oculi]|uniref:SDR family oxidoreductase n=1 Tax=Massilia hydrophila TaxID=3044279 RepID=A0ABS7YCE6_9BURK|nr:SDR family NAD(P)-dependent oxidoreductase [Massilia oculi]MCA1857363.1 SDR family oxidoreductase [Massilia oculi]
MYPELKGKTAIVTGAGRSAGLGAAMARRLAAEGARLVLADLGTGPERTGMPDELAALAAELEAGGADAVAVACDMLVPAQVQALVDAAIARFGQVDILVNNAGVGDIMKPIVELSVQEWDTVLGVNLRGVFLATQAVARHMIARGGSGRIVNIASQAAKSAFPHAAAYTASKHGLVGLTRVAALELGPHGINVNAICPNHVTTGLGAWQNEHFSQLAGQSVDEYLADMRRRIPLGRPGLQEDTANACAFLCSDQSRYMTGESMNVSGGEEYH